MKIKANVLESCTGSSTTRTTTLFFEGPFSVGPDGKVAAEGKDPATKADYKLAATFDVNGSASGTLLQKGVVVGTVCTTYELTWTAQKK